MIEEIETNGRSYDKRDAENRKYYKTNPVLKKGE
jgi:hypothetical protein